MTAGGLELDARSKSPDDLPATRWVRVEQILVSFAFGCVAQVELRHGKESLSTRESSAIK